jgi:hypothetical protein
LASLQSVGSAEHGGQCFKRLVWVLVMVAQRVHDAILGLQQTGFAWISTKADRLLGMYGDDVAAFVQLCDRLVDRVGETCSGDATGTPLDTCVEEARRQLAVGMGGDPASEIQAALAQRPAPEQQKCRLAGPQHARRVVDVGGIRWGIADRRP